MPSTEQFAILPLLGGIIIGLGLLAWFARNRFAGAILIAGLLFISSLGIRTIGGEERIPVLTWIWPLQLQRTNLVFAVSGLLMLGVLFHAGRVRWYYSAQSVLLLLIGIYSGLLLMHHRTVVDGLATIALALLMRLPLIGLTPNYLDSDEEAGRFLRAIVNMMFAWCVVIMVQVFINRGVLFGTEETGEGFRFAGLTANPQSAAIFLAPTAGIGLWCFLNGPTRLKRMFAAVITASTIIMLVWTGSRTGALMFILMASGVFYARVGRAALLAPVLAATVAALWWFATSVLDVDLGLKRLTSVEDTRTFAWTLLWEAGKSNPIFGVGSDDLRASENSLLYGFASYGIGMVILILLLGAVSFVQVVRLLRIQRHLNPFRRRLAHLCISFNAMYFVGAIFEGYIVARISVLTVYMLVFAGITTRLLADHRAAMMAEEAESYDHENHWLHYGEQQQAG